VGRGGHDHAAKTERTEVARPLHVLVPLIKEAIRRGTQASLEHYRRAGEMLLEAKAQLAHGEWGPWLKRHFALSSTSALAYMKLAREMLANSQNLRFSTLSDVAYPYKKARYQTPVDVEKLVQHQQDRENDRRLSQLKLQLIDIGYKVLAAKLHPDKGGSAEAMVRLNRARSELKAGL
jgi:hypothetical protein